MARNIYGLDLGSYEIKVYDKKKDTIWKEKDVIAIADKKEIFAVGDDAYEMCIRDRGWDIRRSSPAWTGNARLRKPSIRLSVIPDILPKDRSPGLRGRDR